MACSSGCWFSGPNHPLRTVDGPERPGLLERTRGVQVTCKLDVLEVRDLPSNSVRSFETGGRVWQLAGPDTAGRLLYSVEDGECFKLMMLSLNDGQLTQLASHSDTGPFWEQHAFSGLKLSTTSDRYFIRRECNRPPEVDGADHSMSRYRCQLEVWNLAGELVTSYAIQAGLGAEWRPHSNEVALTRYLGPAELPADIEVEAQEGNLAPVIFFLDVETGLERAVIAGDSMLFSPDGRFMLVRNTEGPLILVDLDGASARRVGAPGLQAPLALVDEHTLIYHGLTTKGAEQGVTRTIQKRASWEWTVKLADLNTGEFATLVPHVNRFDLHSFGAIEAR